MAHEELRQKQLGQREGGGNPDDSSDYYSLPMINILCFFAYKLELFLRITGNNQVTGHSVRLGKENNNTDIIILMHNESLMYVCLVCLMIGHEAVFLFFIFVACAIFYSFILNLMHLLIRSEESIELTLLS